MIAFSDQPDLSLSDAYRRQARRLRCRFAHDAPRLQRSLGELARRSDDAASSRAWPLPDRATRDPEAARQFARRVEGALEDGLLRYSSRNRLLKAAETMGIERFEANLIIAAVQHRRGGTPDDPPRGTRPWRIIWIILAAELLLLLAGAALLLG